MKYRRESIFWDLSKSYTYYFCDPTNEIFCYLGTMRLVTPQRGGWRVTYEMCWSSILFRTNALCIGSWLYF